jgi:hypothetical protein
MNKTVLFAGAAALALIAGGAVAATPSVGVHGAKVVPSFHLAKGGKFLYNQNSNSTGVGLASMNFTSGSITNENSYGADDFVVPKKTTWTVTEVDASGIYYNGSGPATDENVTFYEDSKGSPGKMVKKGSFTHLKCTDNDGAFSCKLGKKGIQLKSGTYWVSVYADMDFDTGAGQWGWYISSKINGNPAHWENPDNGFETGCTTWGTIGACVGYTGDFMFDLQGKAKKG